MRRLLVALLCACASLAVPLQEATSKVAAGDRSIARAEVDDLKLSQDGAIAAVQMNRLAFGLVADEETTARRVDQAAHGDAIYYHGTPIVAEEMAQIERQLSLEATAIELSERLSLVEGFGGLWIDRNGEAEITIAFAGPIDGDLVESLGISQYRVIQVNKTFAEIERGYEEVAQTLVAAGVYVDSALMVTTGSIEIVGSAESLMAAAKTLRSLSVEIPINFRVGPTSAEEASALFGGLRTQNNSGSWQCTLGLPFVTAAGDHPRPTTAGHCWDNYPNNLHYRQGPSVAKYITHSDGGALDTSVLGLWGDGVLTDHILTYANYQISGSVDLVGGTTHTVGGTICESLGSSAATRCGYVTSTNAGYGNNSGMYKVQICSQGGDSGSAAYWPYPYGTPYAYGVGNHSGATENGATCNSTDVVYIGKYGNIEAAWNLVLYTG